MGAVRLGKPDPRNLKREGVIATPTFTVPTDDILQYAADLFNSFGGVLALAIGFSLGALLLGRVKALF
jgi:hypothetical protein